MKVRTAKRIHGSHRRIARRIHQERQMIVPPPLASIACNTDVYPMLFSTKNAECYFRERTNCKYKVYVSDEPAEAISLHAFMERMRTDGPRRSGFKLYQKGTYARIYKLQDNTSQNLVLKAATYYEDDVFAGAFTESFLLRYFFRQFVLTGLTPHLPVTLSSARSLARQEVLTVTEHAEYGSLHNFFKQVSKEGASIDNTVRLILFQITYTLAWIQHLHPDFRHNDTTSNNILITHAPTTGYTEYRSPDGKVFHVPNLGVRAILWDFDLASIVGVADNTRVYAFEIENPDYAIACGKHGGYDVYHLARWLCNMVRDIPAFREGTVLQQMGTVWDINRLLGENEAVIPQIRLPKSGAQLPLPIDILSASLFHAYHAGNRKKPITNVFGSHSLKTQFLTADEIYDMLSVDPSDLTGIWMYNVPIAFGAPEDVRTLFFTLPSVRMYENLLADCPLPQSDMEITEWPFPILDCRTYVTDVLKDKGFVAERLDTKLEHVMRAFCITMHFLRKLHLRYIQLILLIVLFQEGTEVHTDNYISDIIEYSANTYDVCEVSNSLLQYKWTKLVLAKRN